jgi:hypothetical protein
MRATLLILLMLACAAGSADARRYRHYWRYYNAVTPTEPGSRAYAPRELEPAAPPGGSSEERAQGRAKLVPANWHEEPADPQVNGQRFVSPDGNAWFIAYTVPAGEEGVAAHMKAVAFGDGEQVTYLRGERSWIAVSGFKQGRIFFREAVLACAGDRWHHIAFEYPASAKAEMRDFVERAATAVRSSDNRSCDVPAISNQ